MLNERIVSELAAIYSEEFGTVLSGDEAADAANRLFGAFRILYETGYGDGTGAAGNAGHTGGLVPMGLSESAVPPLSAPAAPITEREPGAFPYSRPRNKRRHERSHPRPRQQP